MKVFHFIRTQMDLFIILLLLCSGFAFAQITQPIPNEMDLFQFAKKYQCELHIYDLNERIALSKDGLTIHWVWDSTIAMTNDGRFFIFDSPIRKEKERFILPKPWLHKLIIQFDKQFQKNNFSQFATKAPLRHQKRFIAIDPGHGGQFPGNVHYNIKEKDLTLNLAKKIVSRLKQKLPDHYIFLTRTGDKSLSLEERAKKAIELRTSGQPGIFISIHANGSINKNAHGIETFFYSSPNKQLDELRQKSIEPLLKKYESNKKSVRTILTKMYDQSLSHTSLKLAESVNQMLYQKLKSYTINRGIKADHFFVIKNINLPSILVEVGFLSHYKEAKRLNRPSYQSLIAEGMADGIVDYIKLNNPKRNH